MFETTAGYYLSPGLIPYWDTPLYFLSPITYVLQVRAPRRDGGSRGAVEPDIGAAAHCTGTSRLRASTGPSSTASLSVRCRFVVLFAAWACVLKLSLTTPRAPTREPDGSQTTTARRRPRWTTLRL